MSSKPTYVEVMRHLAQYATDNLNMDLWRDDDKRKLLDDVASQNEDALDKLAGLRTRGCPAQITEVPNKRWGFLLLGVYFL